MKIKDSGERREFNSGAVRDVCEGKGRCDLLPLDTIGVMTDDPILLQIGHYVKTGDISQIYNVFNTFVKVRYNSIYTALLEVAKHFEEGAKKYDERNWEKGIPLHCYIDSGVRHYCKFMRGDIDEPHDRAFLWNMLCLLATHHDSPEMNDLPFKEVEND